MVVYSPKFHPYQESTYKGVRIKHIYSPETWMGSSVGSFFYDFASLRDALKKEDFDIIYEAGYTSIIPAYIWFNIEKRKRRIFTTNMDSWRASGQFSPMLKTLSRLGEEDGGEIQSLPDSRQHGIHDYYKENMARKTSSNMAQTYTMILRRNTWRSSVEIGRISI